MQGENVRDCKAPIALLTDFGLRDGYVGVMKAVMAGIALGASFIDITHTIAAQDIAAAAWVLASSYRYFPRGTVFVCVVDPGVGGQRLPIALHAGDWFFVGPDNGLFSFILQEQTLHKAVALSNPDYHLVPVSATFQGRDIFSPVAAHIWCGVALEELGEPVAETVLRRLALATPVQQKEQITAQVVYIDHFGNILTNIPQHMAPDLFRQPAYRLLFPGSGHIVRQRRRFFAEASGEQEGDGAPFIYIDSSGYIAVAVQNGHAAQLLNIGVGEQVILSTV